MEHRTLPIGPAIAYARAAAGMSLREVGGPNMVRIEKGRVNVTFAVALRLLHMVGATVVVVTGTGEHIEIAPDREEEAQP